MATRPRSPRLLRRPHGLVRPSRSFRPAQLGRLWRLKAPTRSVPLGLLGALALVFAVEKLEVRRDYAFTSYHATAWQSAGEQLKRKVPAAKPEVLIFGDSLLKFGVYPAVFREASGLRAFNLALPNGSAPSSYILLRRAVKMGVKPTAIVVDFAGDILQEGPRSARRPYPWADLLSFPEAFGLARTSGDPDLFVWVALNKVLHSFKNRFEIRDNILTAFRGKETILRRFNPGFVRNWNSNDGGQVNPKVENPPVPPPPPPATARLSRWACHPVNLEYMERFFTLAERRGIPVVWVIPPFSPTLDSYLDYTGDRVVFDRFVKEVHARHPKVIVVDGHDRGYDTPQFFDGVHLDLEGGTAFTKALADVVSDALNAPDTFPRTVPLPAYRFTETDSGLEPIGLSFKLARPDPPPQRPRGSVRR